MSESYRWVLGDGKDINAIKDQWLRGKPDFKVNQDVDNLGNISVSNLMVTDSRRWDTDKVNFTFDEEDAKLILSTRIPQNGVKDRITWTITTNGQYNVKYGYHLWHDRNVGTGDVIQSNGWGKIWKLALPHKVKVFFWRFCRNNIPVRNRLRSKGVSLPILCSMCEVDVEHLLHVFFYCSFVKQCWSYAGCIFDMQSVDNAPDWLIQKISTATGEEISLIAKVLWGIWFFRKKKKYGRIKLLLVIAMDWSTKFFQDWKAAKTSRAALQTTSISSMVCHPQRWVPPNAGCLKLNVDTSVITASDRFSIGLVLRDHMGEFVAGKVVCLPEVGSMLAAEVTAIFEGLKWLVSMPHQRVVVEFDSLLSVQAIGRTCDNQFEEGHVIDMCRELVASKAGFSLSFVKRHKVAHNMARVPCLLNCQNVFSSSPQVLLESLMYDLHS